ncbi:MAG: hypothetical protein AAFV07_11545, partial [Bacteroidota bacterium]
KRPFEKELTLNRYTYSTKEVSPDTFKLETDLTVEREFVKIGGFRAFKIPFFQEIVSFERFPKQDRNFPLNYWEYEPVDRYEETMEVSLPEGYRFEDLPESMEISSPFITYTVEIQSVDDRHITVKRVALPNRSTFASDSYEAFRTIVKQIQEMEEAYLTYRAN